MMRNFLMSWAPDLLWDFLMWREKSSERREQWGSFWRYHRVKRMLRKGRA